MRTTASGQEKALTNGWPVVRSAFMDFVGLGEVARRDSLPERTAALVPESDEALSAYNGPVGGSMAVFSFLLAWLVSNR
ncbi:hypothetical protein GCM10022237_25200 [Nocardioides ginsengisoli]